ncbi:MAG: PD-(D/E)XK nuclease family protein, partial [Candidatus Bipolaricaulota bacterium]
MEVKRVLSIDEIYRKVSSYDLVLTAEASLADALNNRLQSPQVGKLAYTPRGLIYRKFQNRELCSEKELFLEIISNTNLAWKEAAHLLHKIRDYWNEAGSLDGVLRYLNVHKKKAKTVLNVARNTTNIFQEMESFQLRGDRDLCVIGSYQFNGLDLSVLPANYEEVNIFSEEKTSLPPFQIYDSASDLVGATVEKVLDQDEEEVAVVVHPDSIYNHLLRSSLRQAEVDFQAKERLQDSETLRTLIQFLSLGVRHNRVKAKDASPVLNQLGISLPVEREREYLSMVDKSVFHEAYDFIRKSGNRTFRWAVESLTERGLPIEDDAKQTLMDLDLWESPINRENLNNFKYFLDSFAIEKDQDNKGLLLVNPGSVAYIDRPVVFFLGMTTKWDLHVKEEPWRKLEKERKKNVRNFKALLQSGEKKLFMVQNKKLNRKVTPSTYFNELSSHLSSFTDGKKGKDYKLRKRVGPEASTFGSNHLTRKPGRITTLSASGLNKLAYCPRDYFFTRLVEQPDRDYFRKGNIFHEFAEFLAIYPECVEENGLAKFVDLMVERMKPIADRSDLPGLRTEFLLGSKTLKRYFQANEIDRNSLTRTGGYSPSDDENFFAKKFGKKIDRKFTEMFFLDEQLGARGRVDLIVENEITDYKAGRKNTAGHIVKNSNIDLYSEKPDFQALLYLAHHRRFFPDEKLKFTFFHFLAEKGNVLRGEVKLEDCLTTINYYPWKFSDYLGRDEAFEHANNSNTRKKLLEALGRESFKKIMSRLDFSHEDFYSREGAISYQDEFQSLCRKYLDIGRGKDLTENQLESATGSILKTSFYRLRTKNFFKEDVDRFEEFLASVLEDLNEWIGCRFPVYDNDLDEVTYRDLILAGDGQ